MKLDQACLTDRVGLLLAVKVNSVVSWSTRIGALGFGKTRSRQSACQDDLLIDSGVQRCMRTSVAAPTLGPDREQADIANSHLRYDIVSELHTSMSRASQTSRRCSLRNERRNFTGMRPT